MLVEQTTVRSLSQQNLETYRNPVLSGQEFGLAIRTKINIGRVILYWSCKHMHIIMGGVGILLLFQKTTW
jgi:hypothetical protein